MLEPPQEDDRTRRVVGSLALVAALAVLAAACRTTVPGALVVDDHGPVATVQPPTLDPTTPRGGPYPTTTSAPPPTTTTVPPALSPRPDGTPTTRVTAPADGTTAGSPVVIQGLGATVDRLNRVTLTVKDTATGRYWNPDLGDWQDEWLWYDADVPEPAPLTSPWSFTFDPVGTDSSGLYRVTAFAWDGTGTKDPEGHRAHFTSDVDGPGDRSLVWADEFDGPGLDPSRWKAFTGAYGTPYRDQHYTDRPRNVRVEDGSLVLEAHDEDWGAQGHTSGMVVSNDAARPATGATRGNLSWRYGRFEVRARTPDVAGVWPAFWLRPADAVYGAWPRSGEVDILEYAGPTPRGRTHPLGRFFSAALHTWDPSIDGTGGSKKHEGVRTVDADFFDEFHTFAVEWEPERFRWYLDGELFHVADRDWQAPGAAYPAPFDQPFFITLNLQLGGYAGPVADEQLPATFEIDWVRVYQ